MKVNIYGVGRSGTKAVQVYIAYLLARKFGEVWVNYEPFHWQDRKANSPNHRGRSIHKHTPLLLSDQMGVTDEFARFCEELSQHDVVVTKFIRANGRINLIDQIMKPDLSLVIVRDLYEVLASIAVADWSLVEGRGSYEWTRICEEARSHYPALEDMGCLRPTTDDKLLVHATLWYVMNKHALENARESFFIEYNDLQAIDFILSHFDLCYSDVKISDPMFHGSHIHGCYIIEEINNRDNVKVQAADHLWSIMRGRFFTLAKKLVSSRSRRVIRTFFSSNAFHKVSGSLCRLKTQLEDSAGQTSPSFPRSRVAVMHNDLFDQLSSDVKVALDSALKRQQALLDRLTPANIET